ncbi:MAG: HU family DNA-binding protein [Planctomycetota bacterium]|nr:HU family DNA-binding protein [Planctomycetota bacterium]
MAKKASKSAPAKAAKAPKPAKITAAGKIRKKSELFGLLGEHTGLARKQVAQVFDLLGQVMATDLAKPKEGKPNVFVVPGLMKVQAIYKAATKAAQKPNPFKPGEMMTVKAKPARTVVKVRPLKGLKSMV